jgi:hypothetical protein
MYDPRVGRWLNEDPIEFAGGDTNLYRYCGNGPTNATDPSGLWVRITTTDGREIIANNAPELKDALFNLGSGPNAKIDAIYFEGGHGTQQSQDISDDGRTLTDRIANRGDLIEQTPDGDSPYRRLGNLADMLRDKFDPAGKKLVHLTGCDVARGERNLARSLSEELPGVYVKGNPWKTIGVGKGFTTNLGGPFADKTYLGGVLQPPERGGEGNANSAIKQLEAGRLH